LIQRVNNQELAPSNNLTCPRCQLSHIKKNGQTYYGKQNYQCLICGTQLVIRDEVVSDQTKELMLAANKADRPAILNASTAH